MVIWGMVYGIFFTHIIWLCLKIWYLEIHWLIIMSPIKWPESFRRHTPFSNKAMFSDHNMI